MLNLKNICAPFVASVVLFNLVIPCCSQISSFGFPNYPLTASSSQYPGFNQYPPMYPPIGTGMGNQAAQQGFLDILSPIQEPLFSPNLIAIKNKLGDLIMTNQLEVGPVCDYLVRFQHLDPFDYMIAALLALRDTLPADCPLRQELGQLIVHSIFKRCQARFINGGGNGGQIYPPLPPSPPQPIPLPLPVPQPIPQPQLTCETIINLLNYFQSLFDQYNCQQCLGGMGGIGGMGGMGDMGVAYGAMTGMGSSAGDSFRQFKRNSQQINRRRSIDLNRSNLLLKSSPYSHPALIFEKLIEILPQPQNEMEKLKYNTVKMFLKSSELRKYLKNITSSEYSNKQTLFNLVSNRVVASNVSTNVKDAFTYYLQNTAQNSSTNVTNTVFDYSTLVDLIPQPLDAEENEKFELVKAFLSSKDVHTYLKNIDVAVYADRKLLLKTVLKALAASKLDAKIVAAFTYYSNYEDSLTELELYTKKEITKHFELTKIFIDTLDIDSLSSDAKLAFKKFFKFISNVTREQIKNFDSWSEVKTKGEFMKVLFKYLVSQSFVPEDIKEAIVKLEPLVKMVGRGAAPP